MTGEKIDNRLILILDAEENEAIDYFISKRGMGSMLNGVRQWLDTRKATYKEEVKIEVVNKLSAEEIEDIKERPRVNKDVQFSPNRSRV